MAQYRTRGEDGGVDIERGLGTLEKRKGVGLRRKAQGLVWWNEAILREGLL